MKFIQKLIGNGDTKESRRFWGITIVPLLIATQTMGGNGGGGAQADSKGTITNARGGFPNKIHG